MRHFTPTPMGRRGSRRTFLPAYYPRQRKLRGQGHGEGAAQRLIIGIAGASGVIYGIRALEILRKTGIETHLVMSSAAELTMSYETDVKPKAVREMADVFHPIGDVGASISSGSFVTMGCSFFRAPCTR